MKPFVYLILVWSKGYENPLMPITAKASWPTKWHFPPVSRFEGHSPVSRNLNRWLFLLTMFMSGPMVLLVCFLFFSFFFFFLLCFSVFSQTLICVSLYC